MREVAETSPIVMRSKEIMLSDDEHRLLSEYKQHEYPEHTPFGFIVAELIQEAQE